MVAGGLAILGGCLILIDDLLDSTSLGATIADVAIPLVLGAVSVGIGIGIGNRYRRGTVQD